MYKDINLDAVKTIIDLILANNYPFMDVDGYLNQAYPDCKHVEIYRNGLNSMVRIQHMIVSEALQLNISKLSEYELTIKSKKDSFSPTIEPLRKQLIVAKKYNIQDAVVEVEAHLAFLTTVESGWAKLYRQLHKTMVAIK